MHALKRIKNSKENPVLLDEYLTVTEAIYPLVAHVRDSLPEGSEILEPSSGEGDFKIVFYF